MKRTSLLLAVLLSLAIPAAASTGDEAKSERPKEAREDQRVEAETEGEGATKPVLSPQNVSVKGLKAEKIDGATRIRLDGRFQHALVLRVGPDGARTIECVDEPARVEDLLRVEPDASAASSSSDGEEN